MSTDIKYTIAKLNGDNYFNWRYKMKMLLIEKGVWCVVNDPIPENLPDDWNQNDEKAHSTLALNVEDDQIQHIRNCETAKATWLKLKEVHEKDSANSRVSILKKIMTKRIEEHGDVEIHVNEMNELFQKLLALGDGFEPQFLLSAILLGSLPASYDGLVAILESREEELTASFVCSKIIDEFKRRKERNINNDSIAMVATVPITHKRSKNDIDCYFCKEKGHYKNTCYKYTEWLEKKLYENGKTRPAVVKTEESEEDDEPLQTTTRRAPAATPAPRKIVPTTTLRPVVNGVKRPIQSGTKSKQLPPTKIGTKQPGKTPIGTKTRPQPAPRTTRPVVTTTVRPIVTTEADDEGEDEPLPIRPAQPVPQPRKVPAPQPTKRPVSGVKIPSRPQVTSRIQTTTSGSIAVSDKDDETENNVVNKSPIPSLPRKAPAPKSPTPSGVKGGTKTVIKPRPVITSTGSSSITEEDEEETPSVSERPASPMERIQTQRPRPQPQPGTKTKQVSAKVAPRPVVSQPTLKTTPRPAITTSSSISEDDDEEEISATTRRPAPAPVPTTRRPIINGVKRPILQPQPGTKTRVTPRVEAKRPQPVTTAKTVVEESDDDQEDTPTTRATIRPAPQPTTTLAPRAQRPQIQTTTRRTIVAATEESIDEEEEINEIPATTRKPVPAPMPRRPIGTKTPARPIGTKTRPQPTARPVIVTTVRTTTIEEDDDNEEDETPAPARPVVRATTSRPQTTTRKIVAVEESDDEEENVITVTRKPVPSPMPRRPIGTKTPARPVGTKTRVTPRVEAKRPQPTTTVKSLIELTDEGEEETPVTRTTVRPAPRPTTTLAPRTQRPQIQTTTRRTIVAATEESIDEEEEINEIPATTRKPVPAPMPRRPIGTKTPARPIGTKTFAGTKTPARPSASLPPRVTPTASTSSSIDEEDEEENTVGPTTRRPVPSPMPRGRVQGTKTGGTKTRVSTQSSVVTRVVSPTTTSASLAEEVDENETDDVSSTSRPAAPQPRVTPRPRGVKSPVNNIPTKTRITPAPRIVTTTASTAINEESDDEETLPAIKQPARPAVAGRRVVTRVSTRPAEIETTTPNIVTSTPVRRVVSKTRIESMPVPRPVSFSRKSSKTSPPKEQTPVETTTVLQPIPVPAFESTRRPANPIIQSISVDNEEETLESDSLSVRRAAVRNALSTSDLAKFSSRVKYAERSTTNEQSRSQFRSSYSPPLIEPNEESFVEINRIKK